MQNENNFEQGKMDIDEENTVNEEFSGSNDGEDKSDRSHVVL